MKNWINRIICKLGLCGGHMEHVKDKDGVWWIGLRCVNTGTFHSPIKSHSQENILK